MLKSQKYRKNIEYTKNIVNTQSGRAKNEAFLSIPFFLDYYC